MPEIDEDGCPNFSIVVKGEPDFFTNDVYVDKLAQRVFLPKHYLWPIPTTTLNVMPNIEPNPGY